ncbi:hypothetical protein AA12467_2001 [Gluconobacter sphaericus NBRC 12467]|nr:hypothetical protein AA12467_2001 [Gluconobacter sphaericus NBRC 12467]
MSAITELNGSSLQKHEAGDTLELRDESHHKQGILQKVRAELWVRWGIQEGYLPERTPALYASL